MNLPDVDIYPWDDDREDEMLADAMADACIACGGPLVFLGALGPRAHSRCRNCGLDQSFVIPRSEPITDEDDDTSTDCPF